MEKDDSSLLANHMQVFYEQKENPKAKEERERLKREAELEKEMEEKKSALDKIQEEGKKTRKEEKKLTEPKREGAKIKRIEAKDNVRIFTEEFIGSGDFGYYDPTGNIFVLEKNVIVNNGSSIASGDKFIYDIATKKGRFVGKKDETSIVGNGGDKRVVVVIGDDFQGQKKSRKKSKQENEQNPQR